MDECCNISQRLSQRDGALAPPLRFHSVMGQHAELRLIAVRHCQFTSWGASLQDVNGFHGILLRLSGMAEKPMKTRQPTQGVTDFDLLAKFSPKAERLPLRLHGRL